MIIEWLFVLAMIVFFLQMLGNIKCDKFAFYLYSFGFLIQFLFLLVYILSGNSVVVLGFIFTSIPLLGTHLFKKRQEKK